MQVKVQNSTSTGRPRSDSAVSGSELSHAVAPSSEGRWPSTGSCTVAAMRGSPSRAACALAPVRSLVLTLVGEGVPRLVNILCTRLDFRARARKGDATRTGGILWPTRRAGVPAQEGTRDAPQQLRLCRHARARTRPGVRAAGRSDRGDPPEREPGADAPWRGWDREDGAARVPGRLGVGRDGRAGGGRRGRAGGGGAGGVESGRDLAFASLHQLCAPMLDRRDRLPGPQRQALEIVFGLSEGAAPDRFVVGLAVLSLLSEVAEERPLLCVVDDAQWLDHASALTLAFVARRLLAEPVGIVFAAREPGDELRGMPELEVLGLRDADAAALLGSGVRVMLDERVRARVVAETGGNPLALLELPRGLTATELAGGFGWAGAQPLSGRIEESFVRRLEALPGDARRLLLLAAAEPTGDPLLLWRAAELLGIGPAAADRAAADGLLTIGELVTFRHPLVRSAVYRSAEPEERRAVHLALGEATDREFDPDRRAWHLAAAAPGPDEDVAAELERSAGRAQARGGLAAAAAFLQRAVALTRDPKRRTVRALTAAQLGLEAGAFDAARGLMATAEVGPLDDLERARLDLLRAEAAYSQSRGSAAPELLVRAAKALEPLDPHVARETYLDAWSSALFAGELAGSANLHDVSREALRAGPPADSQRPSDLLLEGFSLAFTTGRAAAVPVLDQAATAFAGKRVSSEEA